MTWRYILQKDNKVLCEGRTPRRYDVMKWDGRIWVGIKDNLTATEDETLVYIPATMAEVRVTYPDGPSDVVRGYPEVRNITND